MWIYTHNNTKEKKQTYFIKFEHWNFFVYFAYILVFSKQVENDSRIKKNLHTLRRHSFRVGQIHVLLISIIYDWMTYNKIGRPSLHTKSHLVKIVAVILEKLEMWKARQSKFDRKRGFFGTDRQTGGRLTKGYL